MSEAPRLREVERATIAYQVAVNQLGIDNTVKAIALWQSVPAKPSNTAISAWLDNAVRLTMGKRSLAVELARAYYRLVSALLTGSTPADPHHDEGSSVKLGELRSEFQKLTGTKTADINHEDPSGDFADGGGASHADDSDSIKVEPIKDLLALEQAAQNAAQQEARTVLSALGPANLQRQTQKIDTTQSADEVDQKRDAAHESAGLRQAAAAERVAMNGARSTTWAHQQLDKRAIGWVRVSLTGTPCGWCAMLISRGPVYKNESSATLKNGASNFDDGDRYHDNCHCVSIPVFTESQYANGPIFALNRQYAEEWPRVTQGLGGKDAVSAWRRHIRQQQQDAATRRAA